MKSLCRKFKHKSAKRATLYGKGVATYFCHECQAWHTTSMIEESKRMEMINKFIGTKEKIKSDPQKQLPKLIYATGKMKMSTFIDPDLQTNYDIGNAIKFLARAAKNSDPSEIIKEIEKAQYYLEKRKQYLKDPDNFEIRQLRNR